MRTITEGQAGQLHARLALQTTRPARGVEWGSAETDGSMIPLVETAPPATGEPGRERRQTRQVRWKEARLSLAHAQGAVTPTFAATLGEPEAVGDQLLDCAIRAGLGQPSRVHSVGDGAPWIADQVQRVFGQQGTYLVDFYHLCDYLAAAAAGCAPAAPAKWFSQQQAQLKQSHVAAVQAAWVPYGEADEVGDKAAPVRCGYR